MSRASLTQSQRRLDEQVSASYVGTLQDQTGTDIALSSLTTITLTLYDLSTKGIINSRNAQDVKNTNNVVITSAGVLTWTLQPADNIIVTSTKRAGAYEKHIALFEYAWAAGSNKHEVVLEIRQLDKVS